MKKIYLLMLFVSVVSMVESQKKPKMPDADMIMAKVVDGFNTINDFSVTINAEIKMERVQIPKMNAMLYFKKPDKVQFSSQGFLLVPREGIAMNPMLLRDKYDASYMEEDTANGQKLLKLQLAAKDIKTRLRQMYIWVDPSNWTITKTETIPYEGRNLSMVFTYQHEQDKYWLPSKLVASFGSMTEDKQTSDSAHKPIDQFEQIQRGMPRTGSVIVMYSNYKVNTGIDDSVFEDKKK